MIDLYTNFHKCSPNVSLVIAVKLKDKHKLRTTDMLLVYILQKNLS
jgi:hypothetical protein